MVRNFYQPDPGPDWTKTLDEVYARQNRQAREDLQNKLEQSAALEKADQGVANLNMLKQILSTTQAGIAAYNKYNSPENKQKRLDKKTKNYFEQSAEKLAALDLRFDKDFNDIKQGDEEGAKLLEQELRERTGKDLSADEVETILEHYWSITGSEMAKWEQVKYGLHVKSFNQQDLHTWAKKTPSSLGKGTVYNDIEGLSIEDEQYKKYLNQYINERTEGEVGNFSDKLKSGAFNEVQRFLNTASSSKKNLKSVAFKQSNLVNKISYLSNLNVSASPTQKAGHLQSWITRSSKKYVTTTDGTTPIQQAVAEIRPQLVKMGEMRELDAATWQDIRAGIIDHPAGDNIIKAFDKDGTFNIAVEEGIQSGIDLDFEQQKALGKSQVQRGFILAANGELDQNQYNAIAMQITTLPGFENKDKLLDDFEKAYYSNQSPEQTQANIDQYDPEVNKGNLTQDHVDSVADTKANKALQDKYDLQELAKTRGNVESKLNGLEGDVTNGKKGVLNLGKISTATNQVRDDIQNFYKENFYAKVHAAGEGADFEILAAQSLAETKTYMEVNGFGKKTNQDGAGKFSSDGWSGEYSLYSQSYANTIISDDYLNANQKASPENIVIWDKSLAKTKEKPGYGTPTERFAQHDGLFPNGMLGHWANSGDISDQMLHIAKKNKLNISRAIGYSINAKLNSNRDEDKAFVKNFNLAKIKTKDWPDQTILDKGYDRVTVLQSGGKNAKDPLQLLAQAKTQGFDSLSRNQMQRLFVYLEGEELTGTEAIRYKLRQSGKSHEEINQIFKDEIKRRKEQLIENTKYTKNYG